jgi:hypothetical protein
MIGGRRLDRQRIRDPQKTSNRAVAKATQTGESGRGDGQMRAQRGVMQAFIPI